VAVADVPRIGVSETLFLGKIPLVKTVPPSDFPESRSLFNHQFVNDFYR